MNLGVLDVSDESNDSASIRQTHPPNMMAELIDEVDNWLSNTSMLILYFP